jgi:hypothetical protein
MARRSCTRMLRGRWETWERCSRPHVILPVQLKAEKIPANFLLFTGNLASSLLKVVLANGCGAAAADAVLAKRTQGLTTSSLPGLALID